MHTLLYLHPTNLHYITEQTFHEWIGIEDPSDTDPHLLPRAARTYPCKAMSHPAHGYYGNPVFLTAPAQPPPPANSYDLPPRGGGLAMPMPREPPRSRIRGFLGRHVGLAISLVLWVIFLLIDVLVHNNGHFPKYPYSNHPHPRGRILVTVVYTFVFQVIWILGVGAKTAWDLWTELMWWWQRSSKDAVRTLGFAAGLLVVVVLPVWPIVALSFNASVLASANKRGEDSSV